MRKYSMGSRHQQQQHSLLPRVLASAMVLLGLLSHHTSALTMNSTHCAVLHNVPWTGVAADCECTTLGVVDPFLGTTNFPNGVFCNAATLEVEAILFTAASISGTLPASFGSLTSLKYLRLSNNTNLGGSLPAEWGNLKNVIEIDLSVNTITGTLPAAWSSLTSLFLLNLGRNNIGGSLPTQWTGMTSLDDVNLSFNNIMGSLVVFISSSVEFVELNNNPGLQGVIPLDWPFVWLLDLVGTAVCATPPPSFEDSHAVILGSYDTCPKSPSPQPKSPSPQPKSPSPKPKSPSPSPKPKSPSPRPKSPSPTRVSMLRADCDVLRKVTWTGVSTTCKCLSTASIVATKQPAAGIYCNPSTHRVTRMYFIAKGIRAPQLPASFQALRELTHLHLSKNAIQGTLPTDWSKLTRLQSLMLDRNHITGTLPRKWSSLVKLQQLSLVINKLKGSVPADWKKLVNFTYLNLERSGLCGPLPAVWTKKASLKLKALPKCK